MVVFAEGFRKKPSWPESQTSFSAALGGWLSLAIYSLLGFSPMTRLHRELLHPVWTVQCDWLIYARWSSGPSQFIQSGRTRPRGQLQKAKCRNVLRSDGGSLEIWPGWESMSKALRSSITLLIRGWVLESVQSFGPRWSSTRRAWPGNMASLLTYLWQELLLRWRRVSWELHWDISTKPIRCTWHNLTWRTILDSRRRERLYLNSAFSVKWCFQH